MQRFTTLIVPQERAPFFPFFFPCRKSKRFRLGRVPAGRSEPREYARGTYSLSAHKACKCLPGKHRGRGEPRRRSRHWVSGSGKHLSCTPKPTSNSSRTSAVSRICGHNIISSLGLQSLSHPLRPHRVWNLCCRDSAQKIIRCSCAAAAPHQFGKLEAHRRVCVKRRATANIRRQLMRFVFFTIRKRFA